MEIHSVVDDELSQSNRRPGPLTPPLGNNRVEDFKVDEDDDDEFVCNPPPNLRAPAVIAVPKPGCSINHTNRRRFLLSRRRNRPRNDSDDSSLKLDDEEEDNTDMLDTSRTGTALDRDDIVTGVTVDEEKNGTSNKKCQDYRIRLLSNVLFLISSILDLVVSILTVLYNTVDIETVSFGEEDYPGESGDGEHSDSEMWAFVTMTLSLTASVGLFMVGCFESCIAETLWTRLLIGVTMMLASLIGITSTILLYRHQLGTISSGLSAISAHCYAIVAISIFVMHEDFSEDANATAGTNSIENQNQQNHIQPLQLRQMPSSKSSKQVSQSEVPQEPTILSIGRRLADNAFMIGTVLDSVLSYFYLFQLTAQALPIASAGAAGFWTLAAILYLMITIQRYRLERAKRNGSDREPQCHSNCCSCCRRCGPTGKDIPVAGTVVDGKSPSTSKQDCSNHEGPIDYFNQQLMLVSATDMDSLCGGGPGQNPSTDGDYSRGMEFPNASTMMMQVDTFFDRHLFCG